ncbi:putative G2/M phase-specific E3 ubiquitin-protein ligase-like [Triplophysa rosa]|uniref:G2/M phase-specific E3 ubiquitin-protein ligase-like n=1 Tax=Triplophysa rosa TaxID=992332 RepID=A0A9W7TPS0_TRIRA|nr:putative G2/M phase-specific E3 ubiquitin-protein ligase-like [Triplophysa rosa]
MMVKFTDDIGAMEEALDTGGPTPAEDNEYFHIGRMIAVSIVHGGPGLCCLSPNFFLNLIGKEKKIEAPIEDIPDDEVRKALLEIKDATSLNELRELTEKHSSMLQTAGCYRFMMNLEDKKRIVDEYMQWYFIYRNQFSIQSFLHKIIPKNIM